MTSTFTRSIDINPFGVERSRSWDHLVHHMYKTSNWFTKECLGDGQYRCESATSFECFQKFLTLYFIIQSHISSIKTAVPLWFTSTFFLLFLTLTFRLCLLTGSTSLKPIQTKIKHPVPFHSFCQSLIFYQSDPHISTYAQGWIYTLYTQRHSCIASSTSVLGILLCQCP